MYEIFFVVSGTGLIKVNDEEFAIGAGTCVTVGPGETHAIVNTGGTEMVLLYFGVEE
jgi:mannose-6-phosphate isomerase-like protein (cupin superfamily)